MQDDLNRLTQWSTQNSLQLNPKKCKCMSITRKRNIFDSVYKIDNVALEKVESLSLLGVTISKDLKWNSHVKDIVSRSNKLLGFIRHIAGAGPSEVLLQLYRTLILPILDYCSPVWSPHTNVLINALERVQRTATRAILHQRRREQDYCERVKQLNLSFLSQRREYMSIALVAKSLLMVGCFDSMPSLMRISPNTRHPESFRFHHLRARTEALNQNSIHAFPRKWSSLPSNISDSLFCNNFHTFKCNLRDHFRSIQEI